MDINEIWGRELQKQFCFYLVFKLLLVLVHGLLVTLLKHREYQDGLNFEGYSVSSERAHVIAKTLFGLQIIPERVMIFDSVQARNFHGSVVERVGAALLACCQMKNIKASLCLMA
ncbi:hypothetical protein R6Q59_029090 [Mikania micrantha]